MSDIWAAAQRDGAAAKLREYLQREHGGDFGLSDDELQAFAEQSIEAVRVSRRRWSWTVLAAEAIRRAHAGH